MPRSIRRLLLALTATLTMLATATPVAAEIPETPPPDFNSPCIHMTDSVYRMYAAYFIRVPDLGGFNYWLGQYRSGAADLDVMSDAFGASEEFQLTYGSLDNAAFVELVYRNVMGRTPDPEGFQYWLDQLNAGSIDRGDLMSFFSESEEFVLKTGTATPVAGFFSQYPQGMTFRCGQDSITVPAGSNNAYIDVLLDNTGDAAVMVTVELLAANGAVVDSATIEAPAGQPRLRASYQPADSVVEYRLTLAPDVFWAVVEYPTFHSVERAGWNNLAAASTGAALLGD